MKLRYSYRAYPDGKQRRALAMAYGCTRVVWNDALRARRAAHTAGLPYVPSTTLSKTFITQAKRTPDRAWLAEVSAVVLQQALRDLDKAFNGFFASVRRKRRGRVIGPPRFKSKKDNRQSIRFTGSAFALRNDGKVCLAKIGAVILNWSRPLPATPSSVTVVKDCCGRYFVSFVVDVKPEHLPPITGETGIDLGLTHFAVLANGQKFEAPRFQRKSERKLGRLHKALARKAKGSNNRTKARIRVARQCARVADNRRDWLHKLSTSIIRDNQAVYVENLAVSGIGRGPLAKSVHDAGWSAFVAMLEYKAARYGRSFGRIGRFEPTSQVCSVCGVKDGPKPLRVRHWACHACETIHDRDVNAARNILAAGRADRRNASPSAGKTAAKATARRVEAGSHRKGRKSQAGISGSPTRERVKILCTVCRPRRVRVPFR